MTQNLSTKNAYIRFMMGSIMTAYGTIELFRNPKSKKGQMLVMYGAMKAAEGATKYCPRKAMASEFSNSSLGQSVVSGKLLRTIFGGVNTGQAFQANQQSGSMMQRAGNIAKAASNSNQQSNSSQGSQSGKQNQQSSQNNNSTQGNENLIQAIGKVAENVLPEAGKVISNVANMAGSQNNSSAQKKSMESQNSSENSSNQQHTAGSNSQKKQASSNTNQDKNKQASNNPFDIAPTAITGAASKQSSSNSRYLQ